MKTKAPPDTGGARNAHVKAPGQRVPFSTLEDGDKRLAASYVHLEEAERIARSGKLSDRESALLSPDIAFICLHAGGLVAECGNCGCLVDEHWGFCARCGAHFMDRRYVDELRDLDV